MKLIKVAAAVLNQTPMAWAANLRNILAAIDAARREDVAVLCLPELCITGYGCEDAFHSRSLQSDALRSLKQIVPASRGMAVSVGLPLLVQNGLFNVAALLVNGQIAGFAAKRHLAGGGLHYEPRWFKPWPSGRRSTATLDNERYPIGDLYFDIGDVKLGFEICEDAWVANRPGGELSLEGVDILLNPSASHFAFGKNEVRKRIVTEGSRAFGVTYVYTNLLGNEAGRAIYDGGALIATNGRLVPAGPRFSFADFALTSATVDVHATRMTQAGAGSFEPNIDGDDSDVVRVSFSLPEREPVIETVQHDEWDGGEHVKHEEFTRALALALFDYLRKSRCQGFVVSLSGGVDSTSVACLVAMMVELALQELGVEGARQRLAHCPALDETAHDGGKDARSALKALARAWTGKLLACVYQSTENSGPVTRQAARQVADAIGATYYEFDVSGLVDDYISMVSDAIGRKLTWETDDLALQNIQARVRSPGVWLLANLRNALLLSTSNRSEAAVGYATMDGDTSGGLSPIAGIDKAYLRRWLKWLETTGPLGLGAIPALDAVNVQAPTAELRPASAGQTDEDDLMPYDVLDAIERAAIRDMLSPVNVYRQMRARFPQVSGDQMEAWVALFFRLWSRNQWKRERYAPSFHVDDVNLDPKTWRRFPILSGGYEQELADLRRFRAESEK